MVTVQLEKIDLISIIGGGPSAAAVDLQRVPGLVIGVNDAFTQARCDIILSMDRKWTEYRWPQLMEMQKPTHLRDGTLKKVEGTWPALRIYGCDPRSGVFTDEPDRLNGSCSGYCAFNLAYKLRPKMVYLFGFDMIKNKKKPYWWDPYPWSLGGATSTGKYKEWVRQFNGAAPQMAAAGIEVINGSLNSAVTAFRREDPRKLM